MIYRISLASKAILVIKYYMICGYSYIGVVNHKILSQIQSFEIPGNALCLFGFS